MPPAIPPSAQMRRAVAAIGRKCRGDFRDAQSECRRLDHHFTGEFHSMRTQIEPFDRISAKRTKAAVEITHWALEEQSSNPREDRIAQITVQRRHGPRQNCAL